MEKEMNTLEIIGTHGHTRNDDACDSQVCDICGGVPPCLNQFCCPKLLTELVKQLHLDFAEEFPVDGLSGTGHMLESHF